MQHRQRNGAPEPSGLRAHLARALLSRSPADPARPHVAHTVMRHTTRVLYELEPAGVEAACAASEHPLGDIRKQVAMAVRPVVDWGPDFALPTSCT